MFRPESKFDGVSGEDPCPICRKPDWCSVSSDRQIAVCMRIPSDKPTRNNGFLHRLGFAPISESPLYLNPPAGGVAQPAAPPQRCNAVYRALLESMSLTSVHQADLLERGFTSAEIRRLGFGTLPARGRSQACKELACDHDLTGVPGFYCNQGDFGPYWTVGGRPGLLIRCLGPDGRIRGLRLRPDEQGEDGKYRWMSSKDRPGGASSGVHCHVARPAELTVSGTVWVTEGEIKAELSAARLGATVISIPGVSSWSKAMPDLDELLPGGGRVVIALDMDWMTKLQVLAAAWDLAAACGARGYTTEVATWDEQFKGLDDALVAGMRPNRSLPSILPEPPWLGKFGSRVLGHPLSPRPEPPACDLQAIRDELKRAFFEIPLSRSA